MSVENMITGFLFVVFMALVVANYLNRDSNAQENLKPNRNNGNSQSGGGSGRNGGVF